MKVKNKRISLLIFSALFICLIISACSNDGSQTEIPSVNDGISDFAEDVTDVAEEEYIYPDLDGGGVDFTFLSPSTTWFYYTDIVHEQMSGEVLDDAIYNRNRLIESKFNIEIKAVERDIGNITGELRKIVAAGDDSYDAAFCPAFYGGTLGALITENVLHNIYDISTMNLDKDWYNQTMLKEAAIGKGNQIYYVGCDIDIMTVQCVVFIFFNQDMMSSLGLELPYKAVREGKWTFDLFYQYMKDGTNLNGADSFKWDLNGPATYGFVAHDNCAVALFEGSSERFVTADSEGMPRLAIEGERFINVLEKMQDMLALSPEGYFMHANNDPATGFHFEPIFKNGRALMITGELKAADVFKDMESTFGIAPMPKFDENQENYFCQLHFGTPVLVIPNTNTNIEFTGAVLDAMAYVSAKDVTPVLFDVSVSQKRLRNEESIEMLQLIKNSGSFDVGSAYGWTTDFYNSIKSSLGTGKVFNAVSSVEKVRDKINASIDKTMEYFE